MDKQLSSPAVSPEIAQPPAPTRAPDRVPLGVAMMLAFCTLAPLIDFSAKLAAQTVPVGQIVLARFSVQAVMMLPLMLVFGIALGAGLNRQMLGQLALRALFLILSTFSFVAAVAVMPVADALAIAFVEPFILLILGRILFGEQVGPRRIGAAAVGFAGAILVIQPSVATFGLVALWPLGTAFFFAFYMLSTRAVAGHMHPVAMQFHTAWIGVAIWLPIMIWADGSGIASLDPVMPQGIAWLWLFGVGFWAATAHMFMTYALKFAPSATVAPLHYFEIVVAVALGYAIFGDFPEPLKWAGIALIVGSGLYIIARERRIARA